MKKLATKLMISVLSVALAFIALGTSTFAWFSMNTTVEASGMQLTAVTPINLLINDGTGTKTTGTWKNSILADEDFGDGLLYPASSADGKTRFNAIMNAGNYINEGNGGIAEDTTKFQKSSTVAESGVVELEEDEKGYWATYTFALKLSEAQDDPVDVYLSKLNFYAKVTVTAGTVNSATGYFTYDDLTGVFNQAELTEGYLAAGTYYQKTGIAGAARAALYTGDAEGELDALVRIYANADETTTKPVSTEIASDNTAYSTIKASNNTIVNAYAAGDDVTFEVNDDPVYVTFVVWIEGQDADCVNANAGQTLKIELAFDVKQA